jgi:predicted TPR repeat methyltransferase
LKTNPKRFAQGTLRVPCTAINQALSPALQQELDAAKIEHQQGRLGEARSRYQHILRRAPQLTSALHYLGVLEHMEGNSELGLSLVQRAFLLSPDDYHIRKNLSNLLTDLNQSEEAEPLCRSLVTERPTEADNHSNHCIVLRKLGRHAEAIVAGRRATALAPRSPAAWLALANALAYTGELSQTADAYERVIAIKPTFSPAHYGLCRVLLQIEQTGSLSRLHLRRTRQAYRRWVDTVPGHPNASFMLEALERGEAPERVPDAAVRSNFDAYAADFDQHIRSLDYCAPELIAEVLARRLPAADARLSVLDGGCGTGLTAPMLRPYAQQLTGVDLSLGMLDRARITGLYDHLVEGELGGFLEAHPESFDVCVLVDVLIYFGDLHAILASAARCLRAYGLLAFSVEKSDRPGSHLHTTGRYSQHVGHVHAALTAAGLVAIEQTEAQIRSEGDAPVLGLIFSAMRR